MRRLVPLAVLLVVGGCEEEPQDEATWRNVSAIFDSHGCAEGNCHSTDSLAGELGLAGLGAYDELVEVPCANDSADNSGQLRVASGDADASFLLTKLEMPRVDTTLGLPMPPTGGSLSDSELAVVRAWIESGADRD